MSKFLSVFTYWGKFKEVLLKHEKVLWILHSVWALTFGILIIIFFSGDFAQVKKLSLYLMALFFLLIVFDRLSAYKVTTDREKKGVKKLIHYVGKKKAGVKMILNYVMKNMYQGLYFFMLPFYWEATVLGSQNMIFTLLVGVLAILATQDLIFDHWLMEKKPLRAGFYAICLFASFNLLLPLFLPLPTKYTVVMASFFASLAFVMLHYPRWIMKKGYLRWVILGSSILAGGCFMIRSVVPPAPYKISKTVITAIKPNAKKPPRYDGVFRIHEKDMDTKEIFCVHILESPINPLDAFHHVWTRNTRFIKKKRLRKQIISVGRYLIWSSIKHSETGSAKVDGDWEVKLFTGGGQILKKRSFLVVK
jgi:Family of unknown function (DUF5924)